MSDSEYGTDVAQALRPASRSVVIRTMQLLAVCLAVLVWAAPIVDAQQPQKPTAAQEGFVPVDQLPSDDQLPAAPLLITAYAAAWLAILLYIVSLWRRLSRVEREIAVLGQRLAGNQRGARQ